MNTRLAFRGLPRVSWGAVFAGVVLSLICYLVLSVLGTAIGATALMPFRYQNPLVDFGFGAGVWLVFTTVASVLVGSYFAGRCAPVLGWLHGLLSWSIVTLFTAYLMTALAGSALNAAGNAAATGANLAAQSGNGNVASSVVDMAKRQLLPNGADGASGAQANVQMRQAADTAARGIARATWWSFALLALGAVIAAAAGNLGFRHQPPVEEEGGAAVDLPSGAAPTGARTAVHRPV